MINLFWVDDMLGYSKPIKYIDGPMEPAISHLPHISSNRELIIISIEIFIQGQCLYKAKIYTKQFDSSNKRVAG